MHELPQALVTMLRAQGVSEAELEQLRTTGSIRRGDGSSEIDVSIDASSFGPGDPMVRTVSVGGVQMGPGTIPPEALERLRRFHRFIPKDSLHQIERATGEDIDGDGVIGAPSTGAPLGAAATSVPAPDTYAHHAAQHAQQHVTPNLHPTGSGPFVETSPVTKLFRWVVALAVLGIITYLYATR